MRQKPIFKAQDQALDNSKGDLVNVLADTTLLATKYPQIVALVLFVVVQDVFYFLFCDHRANMDNTYFTQFCRHLGDVESTCEQWMDLIANRGRA